MFHMLKFLHLLYSHTIMSIGTSILPCINNYTLKAGRDLKFNTNRTAVKANGN